MRKYPIVLFGALLAAAAWRVNALAGHLPPIVAVHFNASGNLLHHRCCCWDDASEAAAP